MEQVSPKYIKSVMISTINTLVLLYAIFGFCLFLVFIQTEDSSRLSSFLWIGLGLSLFILIISWFVAKLSYRFYKYELRKEGIYKETGILFKKYLSIPYSRVQNINIKRGLIDRMLNLSTLQIYTAGSSHPYNQAEGHFPAFTKEKAEELRQRIMQKINSLQSKEEI